MKVQIIKFKCKQCREMIEHYTKRPDIKKVYCDRCVVDRINGKRK